MQEETSLGFRPQNETCRRQSRNAGIEAVMTSSAPDDVRLDSWLWAARFFKTRGAATQAIDGGKVQLNGRRAKRSKSIRAGDAVGIRKGPYRFAVVVKNLAAKRLSAKEAVLLYEETAESRATRENLRGQLRAVPVQEFKYKGRPGKKERRALKKIKGR